LSVVVAAATVSVAMAQIQAVTHDWLRHEQEFHPDYFSGQRCILDGQWSTYYGQGAQAQQLVNTCNDGLFRLQVPVGTGPTQQWIYYVGQVGSVQAVVHKLGNEDALRTQYGVSKSVPWGGIYASISLSNNDFQIIKQLNADGSVQFQSFEDADLLKITTVQGQAHINGSLLAVDEATNDEPVVLLIRLTPAPVTPPNNLAGQPLRDFLFAQSSMIIKAYVVPQRWSVLRWEIIGITNSILSKQRNFRGNGGFGEVQSDHNSVIALAFFMTVAFLCLAFIAYRTWKGPKSLYTQV